MITKNKVKTKSSALCGSILLLTVLTVITFFVAVHIQYLSSLGNLGPPVNADVVKQLSDALVSFNKYSKRASSVIGAYFMSTSTTR